MCDLQIVQLLLQIIHVLFAPKRIPCAKEAREKLHRRCKMFRKMKSPKLGTILLMSFIMLVGAAGMAGCNQTKSHSSQTTGASEAAQAADSTIVTAATEPPTPTPVLVLPLTENTSGKTMIQTVSASSEYPYNTYVITSSSGQSIVLDPCSMPSPDTVDFNPIAIISTHGHPDHTDPLYTPKYDCLKIKYTVEDVTVGDFHIYTIASSHMGDTIIADTNVIVVVEVDGLRIAHMGDIGQTTMTQDQLDQLGDIDIAFMQFSNSFSKMSTENGKGLTLISQVNPNVIIPTHYADDTFAALEPTLGPVTEIENVYYVSPSDLPAADMSLIHITNTHVYH